MDAGFEFKHSLEEMLDDTIQCCKEKGYLWLEKRTGLYELSKIIIFFFGPVV